MEPSKQSVDAIKRVVAEARKKAGSSHSPAHGFNEEDVGGYMDGALLPLCVGALACEARAAPQSDPSIQACVCAKPVRSAPG